MTGERGEPTQNSSWSSGIILFSPLLILVQVRPFSFFLSVLLSCPAVSEKIDYLFCTQGTHGVRGDTEGRETGSHTTKNTFLSRLEFIRCFESLSRSSSAFPLSLPYIKGPSCSRKMQMEMRLLKRTHAWLVSSATKTFTQELPSLSPSHFLCLFPLWFVDSEYNY